VPMKRVRCPRCGAVAEHRITASDKDAWIGQRALPSFALNFPGAG
jgi:hypothetical protein